MWTVIFVTATFILGIFLGYRIGSYFIRKENIVLHKQLQLLKEFSAHWAKEATAKNELNRQVATQQTENTATAIQTFIQLLQSFQQKQSESINQEEKEKMEKIINQVKNNFS